MTLKWKSDKIRATKPVTYGEAYGTLPVPKRDYYDFAGWFTKAGTKVTENNIFNIAGDVDLYAKWIKETINISLNPNGGTLDSTKITATTGTKLGELPIPINPGYTFTGWFLEDGTKITTETIFTVQKNITIVAHWFENTWSNWSVEKPSGDNIQIETRKIFKGYNMVSYCIKDAKYGNLCYRGYSIPATEPEKNAYDTIVAWGGSGEYGECNDGQIPVNSICFESKIQSKYLSAISDIYKKFDFEKD